MAKWMGKFLLQLMVFLTIFGVATPARAAWVPNFWPTFWWLRPVQSVQPVQSSAPTPKPVNFLPFIASRSTTRAESNTESNKIVAGWLTPWGDDSFESFKNNLDILTEVHPFVYTIGADGISVVPDQAEWRKAEVMGLAKQHNIKIIPTISGDVNYSDIMLNDPIKRTAHINAIMEEIRDNGYDGFDIDYEGFLNGYNRDVYATFMQELATRLRAEGKITAVAVEAFNRQQSWEELGKAVDRFIIMGYDYHSARGPAVGPIGPAAWLREIVEYAATRVPREKIVLGLGTYGYSWIHNGAQYVSEAVGYKDALAIAAQTGATVQRQNDTPYFSYDRGLGQRYLYFEDAVSTKPKLALIDETGIAGIAFWRLGTEDPRVWDEVKATIK